MPPPVNATIINLYVYRFKTATLITTQYKKEPLLSSENRGSCYLIFAYALFNSII